jgi:hypothetical protein
VRSDHKPLESILKKPLYAAPKRLQRMLLQLQKYDIRLQYTPVKEMYIADTLSRAYHEAVSSELILAVCDLTSLELFFHMYIGETFRVQI